jgi:hypothetical protein
LKAYHTHQISDLSGDVKTKLDNLIAVYQLLYGTAPFAKFIDVAKEVFMCSDLSTSENLAPGSVGAFFCGCFTSNKQYKGDLGCSPLCAGSLPPQHGTEGWNFCNESVLLYQGNKVFKSLHEGTNKEEAIIEINVTVVNFKGFTKDEITQLESLGIKRIKIVKNVGGQKEYTDTFPLSNYLLQEERDGELIAENTISTRAIWVCAIFIAIVLILLAIYYCCYYGKKDFMEE